MNIQNQLNKNIEEFNTEWQRYLCPAPPSEEMGWLEKAEVGRERTKDYLKHSQLQLLQSVVEEIETISKDWQAVGAIDSVNTCDYISSHLTKIINDNH